MDIRRISDKVYHDDDRYKMEEMNKVYYRMADRVKELDPNMYDMFVEEAENIAYTYSRNDAEKYVNAMGPYGQHWSYDDVKNYVKDRGVADSDVCDYYVAMNMAYNDYRRTAEKYGTDRTDFYFDIAWDYINDEDSPDYKVARNLIFQ